MLQGAYNRCVSVLNASSKPSDVAVQVCANIARCYTAAASFPMCREKLIEMSHFIKDLCHTLYFKVIIDYFCITYTKILLQPTFKLLNMNRQCGTALSWKLGKKIYQILCDYPFIPLCFPIYSQCLPYPSPMLSQDLEMSQFTRDLCHMLSFKVRVGYNASDLAS